MTVEITSECFGKQVGETYTGPMEAWLLSEGYAKQAGYTGPGVANTGAAATTTANDPRLPENREAPYFPLTEDENTTVANDSANLNDASFPNARFDFDAGSVDTEAPVVLGLEPNEGPAAGGTVVRITGDNLEGTTAVTFDAVAGTALDASTAGELGYIEVTTPANAAGPSTVVVTDNVGTDTEVGAFTYTA